MTRNAASSLVLTSVLGLVLAAAAFGFVVTQANAASSNGKDKKIDDQSVLNPLTLQVVSPSERSGNRPAVVSGQPVQVPARPATRSPYRPPLF